MSRKQTLQQSECDHIARVKEWGFNDKFDFIAVLWDCTRCGEVTDKLWEKKEEIPVNHSNCNEEPCFGCKAKGLQLSAGDASSNKLMPKKKHESELEAYRRARKQGIQPAGTTMAKIEEAHKASEVLGEAYKAGEMPAAKHITKTSAEVMKELKK